MKNIIPGILTMVMGLCFSIGAGAQAQLSSVSPGKFYTQSENVPMRVTISGKNIWPDYMDNNAMIERVKVFFKKGDKVQEIRKSGSNASQTSVSFFSGDWLTTATPVEVYLVTDGKRSNSVTIQVLDAPRVPPVINSISPSKFTTGQSSDKYLFRVYAKNLGEERTTSAWVNGKPANQAWHNLPEGVMDVWIPRELTSTPGTYQVKVATRYGESNQVSFTIEKPALKMIAVSPVKVSPNRNAPIANTERIAATKIDLKPVHATAMDPSMKVLSGIRVQVIGVMKYAEDRSVLENYIRELDRVMFIDNQAILGDNSQLNIRIKGADVERTTLDHVKLSIEKKLKGMGITGAVVVE